MVNRTWAAGVLAGIAALALAFGAARSGETVQFDTVSDILATKFNSLPGATSDLVFDESVIRTYELTVAAQDWAWLNENPLLEQYVPASLSFEGRTFADSAVRYKGSFGALRFCFDRQGNQTCEKLSLKLKFNEYNKSGRFFGLQRLNLHSMESDPTKMHDALGYGLYRAAGVPAPRTAFARVVVNGELIGLFAVVEQVDEEFIANAFPDAGLGTLYKEVWPEHSTAEPYETAVVAGPTDGAETMLRFAKAIQAADDDAFLATLDQWTDLDTFMNYLAVDRLIDNWDGIVAWYCLPGQPCFNHNFFWYEEAFTDRLWLIPWDLDHTFEYPSPIRTRYGMPDWDAEPSCERVPVFLGIPGRPPACDEFLYQLVTLGWDGYAAASRELLEGPFSVEALHARIDALSVLLSDAVAEDPNGPAYAVWELNVEKLKTDVVLMRSAIELKVEE